MKTRVLFCYTWLLPLVISANGPQGINESNNMFAFKLFDNVKSGADKNIFYSPFSISTALAMTYAGARNETALQISQTMNFRPGNTFHSDYKYLLNLMNGGTDGKIKLNIANGLWAQKNFKFLDSYFDIVKSNYHSVLQNVDFTDDIEREKTRKEINGWVENQTNEKNKELNKPG